VNKWNVLDAEITQYDTLSTPVSSSQKHQHKSKPLVMQQRKTAVAAEAQEVKRDV